MGSKTDLKTTSAFTCGHACQKRGYEGLISKQAEGRKTMIHKKRMISLLSLGLVVLALVLVPGAVWAVDKDGDTFHKPADCDDRDATVHPGAVEICDEKDNDCNGIVDDTPQPCGTCTDADSDNYYAEEGCGTPLDCNDEDATIYPWATELCDDKDNDCDDDLAPVNPGVIEICGSGIDDNCNNQIDEDCSVAGDDSDGDGLSDQAESAGFLLSDDFDSWWDGSEWVSAQNMIPSTALSTFSPALIERP